MSIKKQLPKEVKEEKVSSKDIIAELDDALAQSDKNSLYYRFNNEENKGKSIAIKNFKSTDKKSSMGTLIYSVEVYDETAKKFVEYLANFPTYMQTRLANMRTNGLGNDDIVLIKYVGKKDSKKFKGKSYDDFFIETLSDFKERTK